MVNDLATQHAEPDRNCKVSMIVDRFLPTLSIWIGNDWVFATTEKDTDLSLQIDDVLIGPSKEVLRNNNFTYAAESRSSIRHEIYRAGGGSGPSLRLGP